MDGKNNILNKSNISVHHKASKYILAAVFAALFLLVVWGICIVAGTFSDIEQIVVDGNSPYSDSQIIAVSGIVVGSKTKALDADRAERDILNNLTYVADVKIKKRGGGQVIIRITPAQPAYISNISNEYYVISNDFKVLGIAGDIVLEQEPWFIKFPLIKRSLVGTEVVFYEDVSYIDEFIDIIQASPIAQSITSVDVSDKYNLSVIYDGCHIIRFGEIKDMDAKFRKLDMVLNSDMAADLESAIIDISNVSNPIISPR